MGWMEMGWMDTGRIGGTTVTSNDKNGLGFLRLFLFSFFLGLGLCQKVLAFMSSVSFFLSF